MIQQCVFGPTDCNNYVRTKCLYFLGHGIHYRPLIICDAASKSGQSQASRPNCYSACIHMQYGPTNSGTCCTSNRHQFIYTYIYGIINNSKEMCFFTFKWWKHARGMPRMRAYTDCMFMIRLRNNQNLLWMLLQRPEMQWQDKLQWAT